MVHYTNLIRTNSIHVPLSNEDFFLLMALIQRQELAGFSGEPIYSFLRKNLETQALAMAKQWATLAALAFYQLNPQIYACCLTRAAKLAAQLDSPRFRERESAQRELRCLGPCAIAALRNLPPDSSPEARQRASTLLDLWPMPASHSDLDGILRLVGTTFGAKAERDMRSTIQCAMAAYLAEYLRQDGIHCRGQTR
jgi:hypothetical protein